MEELTEDSTFNIVGEKATKIALDLNVIDSGCIGKVQNIPFSLKLL